MRKDHRKIFKRVLFRMMVCMLWLNAAYSVFAESSSIDVRQPVIYVGGGFSLPVDATPPEIFDVKIYDVGRHSARISLQTDDACLAELRYGIDSNLESGPLYDHPDSYERLHEFSLENLTAGSKYYLNIKVKSSKGIERSTSVYSFYTAPEILTVPNVGSLSAARKRNEIILSWRNPAGENFSGVQINRQTLSPAFSPSEGKKVFSGLAENFTDADIADGVEYYYTVFSYGDSGSFSSGAILKVAANLSPSANEEGQAANEKTPSSGGGEKNGQGQGSENATGKETGIEVGNVADLSAVPYPQDKKIVVSWKCPDSGKECAVEVRRSSDSSAGSVSGGDLVYSGSGSSFEDSGLEPGRPYFYTVFTKSGSGSYSSGVTAMSQLSTSDDSGVLPDMFFINATRGILLDSDENRNVYILEGDTLGISCTAASFPAHFKAAVVTIDDVAYILNSSDNLQSYWTNLAVPETGAHNLSIEFVAADGGTVSYRNFTLNVIPKGKIFAMKGEKISEIISNPGKLLCWLGNFAGRNDGTCMLAEGVEGAKITVFKKGSEGKREVWNAKEFSQDNPSFSAGGGSFGFSVPNGEYEIAVEKDGFESRTISLSVANNAITGDVEIFMEKNNTYGIILMGVLFISIAVYTIKPRLSIRRK